MRLRNQRQMLGTNPLDFTLATQTTNVQSFRGTCARKARLYETRIHKRTNARAPESTEEK